MRATEEQDIEASMDGSSASAARGHCRRSGWKEGFGSLRLLRRPEMYVEWKSREYRRWRRMLFAGVQEAEESKKRGGKQGRRRNDLIALVDRARKSEVR